MSIYCVVASAPVTICKWTPSGIFAALGFLPVNDFFSASIFRTNVLCVLFYPDVLLFRGPRATDHSFGGPGLLQRARTPQSWQNYFFFRGNDSFISMKQTIYEIWQRRKKTDRQNWYHRIFHVSFSSFDPKHCIKTLNLVPILITSYLGSFSALKWGIRYLIG